MTTPTEPKAKTPPQRDMLADRLENISRQLRSPLADILGMAHLLNDTVLEKDQSEYVQAIMRASHEVLVRVDNSLDMASLSDETLGVQEESFSITEALLAMVERLRPSAASKNLGISLEYAPDMDTKIYCDKARLAQAIYNLAASLISTHCDGSLRFAAGIESDQWGDSLSVLITTSASTAKDEQVGEDTSDAIDVTRRLARLMGGEVSFTCNDGQANCARLTIRIGQESNAAGDSGAAAEETVQTARILVAEDSRANQRMIGLILQKLGYDYEVVANGVEAFDAVRTHHFDMVLMDLHMPQMDGMEACRKIRALPDETAAMVPVVALTADVRPQVRTKVLEAGMDAYLSKPLDVPKLAEVIQTSLARARNRQTRLAKTA